MKIKFLHLITALTVLLSAVGVTVNRHYCQKQLRAVGVWWVPESCHEAATVDDSLPSCPFHAQNDSDAKKNCCEEESEYLTSDTDKNFVSQYIDLLTLNSDFLDFESDTLMRPRVFLRTEYIRFCFHPPPLLDVSRRVLFQTFLL